MSIILNFMMLVLILILVYLIHSNLITVNNNVIGLEKILMELNGDEYMEEPEKKEKQTEEASIGEDSVVSGWIEA